MARNIMILEVQQQIGGLQIVRFALWLPVTPGEELDKPAYQSQWKDIATKDASLLAQLRSGQVIEEIHTVQMSSASTGQQIQDFLENWWTARNSYLSQQPMQGRFYGRFWDGVVWARA
jgi:hypothetical protein